jgi:hypothetical protein
MTRDRGLERNCLWLLKNYFEGVLVQNSLCNLLNFRSTNTPKFLEITVLVLFSTTTGDFTQNPDSPG